jgi:hypothetical protein
MSNEEGAKWLPYRARQSDERAAERRELQEGFPSFLEPSVVEWVFDAQQYMNARETERLLRVTLPDSTTPYVDYWHRQDVAGKVEFLDYALHVLETDVKSDWSGSRLVQNRRRTPNGFTQPQRSLLAELELILSQGGSVWRVVTTPGWSLERRASEEMRALVSNAAVADLDAGRALASAWHACYGARPAYSSAYDDAVTAVEACLLPATTPNDPKATFGKALAHVRDTEARWSVGGLKGSRSSGATLVAMLETLWQGQQRHAQPDGTVAGVSQAEAEAAVSLAVTLVHWFTAGLVVKRQ